MDAVAAVVGAGPVVVEDVQRVGIGLRVVVPLAEEECPIVEDARAAQPPVEVDQRNRDEVAGQTETVGEDCHLQRQ